MKYLFALIISLSFTLCLGCEVDIGNGMQIKYSTADGTLYINFIVSSEIWKNYGWVGLGLKREEDGTSMEKGDYYTILTEDNSIEDGYGEEPDAEPTPDEELGGEDSITSGSVETDNKNTRTYAFSRWLDTKDSYDTQVVIGNVYYWQWAYGDVDDGAIQEHVDRDSVSFIFEECSDTDVIR